MGRRSMVDTLANRIIGANRRDTYLGVGVLVMAIIIVFSSAIAVIYTRPIHTTSSADGSVRLEASDGSLVETGSTLQYVSLLDLAASGDFGAFDRMSLLSYEDEDGAVSSGRLESWQWEESRLVLHLVDSSALLLDNGFTVVIGPADGVVRFNATGSTRGSGQTSLSTDTLAAATSQCTELACPLEECVVATAKQLIKRVTCAGVEIWQWPQGVSYATHGHSRHLFGLAFSRYQHVSYASISGRSNIGVQANPWGARKSYFPPRPPPPPPSPSPPPPPFWDCRDDEPSPPQDADPEEGPAGGRRLHATPHRRLGAQTHALADARFFRWGGATPGAQSLESPCPRRCWRRLRSPCPPVAEADPELLDGPAGGRRLSDGLCFWSYCAHDDDADDFVP